jgi:Holliday junction resolvase RusA-like endonuclease
VLDAVLLHGQFDDSRMADEETELEEEEEGEIGEAAPEEKEQVTSSRTLVDIPVIPFEPPTPGSGQDIGAKQGKLRTAIMERISQNELGKFREACKGRLVTITLGFFLWKGSTKTTNTRAVKDLDNLMKIIFDVLGKGQQGLGILEEDSYICEVYAKKELVEDSSEEGLRIIVEEYEDEEMAKTLREFYAKKNKSA